MLMIWLTFCSGRHKGILMHTFKYLYLNICPCKHCIDDFYTFTKLTFLVTFFICE